MGIGFRPSVYKLPLTFILAVFLGQDIQPWVIPSETEAQPPSSIEGSDQHRTESVEKISRILSRFDTGLSWDQENRISSFIEAESRRYGYDPELILAMIFTESSFRNRAVSDDGAVGLMQIIPDTGRELAESSQVAWRGTEPLFDPFVNIHLGIQYLKMMHQKFGDLRLALEAYNQGPNRVLRWLNHSEPVPMDYAEKVLTEYQNFLSSNTPAQKIELADRTTS